MNSAKRLSTQAARSRSISTVARLHPRRPEKRPFESLEDEHKALNEKEKNSCVLIRTLIADFFSWSVSRQGTELGKVFESSLPGVRTYADRFSSLLLLNDVVLRKGLLA